MKSSDTPAPSMDQPSRTCDSKDDSGEAQERLAAETSGLTLNDSSQAKCDPAFLRLPREGRDNIYEHLLTIDQGPEFTPLPDNKLNFAVEVLGVNRLIRSEALETFQKRNLWILVTYAPEDGTPSAHRSLVLEMAQKQQAFCKASWGPIHDAITREPVLEINLGKDCGQANTPVNWRAQAATCLTFAYSKTAYGYFLADLSARVPFFQSMTVTLNKHPRITASEMQAKFLRPMAAMRALSNVVVYGAATVADARALEKAMLSHPKTYDDIFSYLEVFKKQGRKAYESKNYVEAIYHYGFGSRLCYTCSIISSLGLERICPEGNKLNVIEIEFKVNLCLATNKLVESRRRGPLRELANVTIAQLNTAVIEMAYAFRWPGMLAAQRAKAHYVYGVALANIGENQELQSRRAGAYEYFKEAAQELFYAKVLVPGDKLVCQALANVDKSLGSKTTELTAPLRRIPYVARDGSRGTWIGSSRLADGWKLDNYPFHVLFERA